MQTVAAATVPAEIAAQITGLEPATDYLFRVAAFNEAGLQGVYTDPVGLKTGAPAAAHGRRDLQPRAGRRHDLDQVRGRRGLQQTDEARTGDPRLPDRHVHGTVALTASKGSSQRNPDRSILGRPVQHLPGAWRQPEAVLSLAGGLPLRAEEIGQGRARAHTRARKTAAAASSGAAAPATTRRSAATARRPCGARSGWSPTAATAPPSSRSSAARSSSGTSPKKRRWSSRRRAIHCEGGDQSPPVARIVAIAALRRPCRPRPGWPVPLGQLTIPKASERGRGFAESTCDHDRALRPPRAS